MPACSDDLRGGTAVIGDIFAVTIPGFAIGAALMALTNRRVPPAVAQARWLKFAVYFLIVHTVLVVAAAGEPWVTALVSLILAAGALELRRAWLKMQAPRPSRVWPAFIAVAALALCASWRLPPGAFAFIFLVTATCDGFSQVVGQLVGRHSLARNVSPAKTIEGLAGGLFAGLVVALLARGLLTGTPAWVAALVAMLVGLAGLAGDLAASWVKRRAGIKDYSSALPGQGGVLDRFDSLLGAMAIVGNLLVVAGG
jgi:phosphatidate cytidylyltransferase